MPPTPNKRPIFIQSCLIRDTARLFNGVIDPSSVSSWSPSISSTAIISPLPRTSPIIFHSCRMPHSFSMKYVPTSVQLRCKPSSSITYGGIPKSRFTTQSIRVRRLDVQGPWRRGKGVADYAPGAILEGENLNEFKRTSMISIGTWLIFTNEFFFRMHAVI